MQMLGNRGGGRGAVKVSFVVQASRLHSIRRVSDYQGKLHASVQACNQLGVFIKKLKKTS